MTTLAQDFATLRSVIARLEAGLSPVVESGTLEPVFRTTRTSPKPDKLEAALSQLIEDANASEGEYLVEWRAESAEGTTEGVYTQVVYGSSLVEAMANWDAMHGGLAADEHGTRLMITKVWLEDAE